MPFHCLPQRFPPHSKIDTVLRLYVTCLLMSIAFVAPTVSVVLAQEVTASPNVLLIFVDDLKPALGCYGDMVAQTPSIDRLAQRGVLFESAYCNQAICSPSRISLMTGLRPQTLGIYNLTTHFRLAAPDAVTVAQSFLNHGYQTQAMGKILHPGLEDPPSWSIPPWEPYKESSSGNNGRGPATRAAIVDDDAYDDGKIAAEAVERIQQAALAPEQPFFIAVGFHKPHLPFSAPQKYWDLYDPATLPMPQSLQPPLGAPSYAANDSSELRQYSDMPAQGPISETDARKLIHGYYAATSYVDAQVGKVLDALDNTTAADNTIVVLWGDHGWHLGDHGFWCKHSNYEQATRIPLIISSPGCAQGQKSTSLMETVDIYPTLCELAGVIPPGRLDGTSFAGVVNSPTVAIRESIIHVYPRGRLIGRAIRTDQYRMVEWKEAGAPIETAEYELYDYQSDPQETANLAESLPDVLTNLKEILRDHPEAKHQFNPTVQLNGATLQILGTAGNDRVEVTQSTASHGVSTLKVIRNGTNFWFDPEKISLITIDGLQGNDVLVLDPLVTIPARLRGGDGNDNLIGGGSHDTLEGNSGNDKLTGGPGDDVLIGSLGDDHYEFGIAATAEADVANEFTNQGIDTLSFAALTTDVKVSLGTTTIQNLHANRTLKLNSISSFENANGGSGNDTLNGNLVNNRLTGNAGNDRLTGGQGSDVLIGGLSDDLYEFGIANAEEADVVTEVPDQGTDTLSFATLTFDVKLSLGTTAIQNVHTNRTLKLNSVESLECVTGGSGNDTLHGNLANNRLTGNAGNDSLRGGAGSDVMIGGPGDDLFEFGLAVAAEADVANEVLNQGVDTLSFATLATDVKVSLGTTVTQNVHANRTLKLNNVTEFEIAIGGAGNDALSGNTMANVLVGNSGNDRLSGLGERDILVGGVGIDSLLGGDQDDILIPGPTMHDTHVGNLNNFRKEWLSLNGYTVRIANLRSGVGSPVVSLAAVVNVFKDSGEADFLTGATGRDWFFRDNNDVVQDLLTDEIADQL